MAGVAQLVEHQFVALGVAGSSPVARPTKKAVDISIAFFISPSALSACKIPLLRGAFCGVRAICLRTAQHFRLVVFQLHRVD